MNALAITMLIINIVMLFGVVTAVILYMPRPLRRRRYDCEGCGHSITTHLTDTGVVGRCQLDGGVMAALTGNSCSCRAYLGKEPARLPTPQPASSTRRNRVLNGNGRKSRLASASSERDHPDRGGLSREHKSAPSSPDPHAMPADGQTTDAATDCEHSTPDLDTSTASESLEPAH